MNILLLLFVCFVQNVSRKKKEMAFLRGLFTEIIFRFFPATPFSLWYKSASTIPQTLKRDPSVSPKELPVKPPAGTFSTEGETRTEENQAQNTQSPKNRTQKKELLNLAVLNPPLRREEPAETSCESLISFFYVCPCGEYRQI